MTNTQQTALAWEHLNASRQPDAERIFREVLLNDPAYAPALDGLGWLAFLRGDLEAAQRFLDRAIEAKPGFADAHLHIAAVLFESGQIERAVVAARRAAKLAPARSDVFASLGAMLQARGENAAAVEAYRKALALNPIDPFVWTNLATALAALGDPSGSADAARRAIAQRPDISIAHTALASALESLGDPAGAADALRLVIALEPQNADAHAGLGAMLLLMGDFEQGWPEREWRLKSTDPNILRIDGRIWDGSDLRGRSILLHAEQGFGDAIQFARYATVLAQRGARVLLRCRPELVRLLSTVPGVAEVVAHDAPVPPADEQTPLMSLPTILGTRLQKIPVSVPYVSADPVSAARWGERMHAPPGRLRVGLCWTGRTAQAVERSRSIEPALLAPLAVPHVHWFSLQKFHRGPMPPLNMQDFTAELSDFADTAALIANLDLVITVDTAVAHLAGALGKPVWVLLRSNPDWRWLLDRDDSPWYPSMRLFRQKMRNDWRSVLTEVAAALTSLSA